jgi:hypothetical protein
VNDKKRIEYIRLELSHLLCFTLIHSNSRANKFNNKKKGAKNTVSENEVLVNRCNNLDVKLNHIW